MREIFRLLRNQKMYKGINKNDGITGLYTHPINQSINQRKHTVQINQSIKGSTQYKSINQSNAVNQSIMMVTGPCKKIVQPLKSPNLISTTKADEEGLEFHGAASDDFVAWREGVSVVVGNEEGLGLYLVRLWVLAEQNRHGDFTDFLELIYKHKIFFQKKNLKEFFKNFFTKFFQKRILTKIFSKTKFHIFFSKKNSHRIDRDGTERNWNFFSEPSKSDKPGVKTPSFSYQKRSPFLTFWNWSARTQAKVGPTRPCLFTGFSLSPPAWKSYKENGIHIEEVKKEFTEEIRFTLR